MRGLRPSDKPCPVDFLSLQTDPLPATGKDQSARSNLYTATNEYVSPGERMELPRSA